MIHRDLDVIEEGDLQALCDAGREEDERIEFKQSFVGGGDLNSMSDPQRERALESLAKEVTAFLNAKGGDLIIGIREDEGSARELTPIDGASDAAERIRRSLASRIEPAPRSLRIRSILAQTSENGEGYVLIRAERSLEAPHRVARSREFYSRRGTEASPMNIREIHDLVISSRIASARIEDKLQRELAAVHKGQANNRQFSGGGFQFRAVYVPLEKVQVPLEGSTLRTLANKIPRFVRGRNEIRNDVAFRLLGDDWRPVLRGRLNDRLKEGDKNSPAGYAGKRVDSDGTVVFDWFVRSFSDEGNVAIIYLEWYLGFLAEICGNLAELWNTYEGFGPGVIGVAIRSELHNGNLPQVLLGGSMFTEAFTFPAIERVHELPYFALDTEQDLSAFFVQAQEDILALAGTSTEPARLP